MIASTDILKIADKEGYAVPAFNYSDIWDLQAIVEAAEEEQAVVMVMACPLVIDTMGMKMNAAIGQIIMEESKTPVLLHLDHCDSVETCLHAIDCGFRSVMIDASQDVLEDNIDKTKQVVDYAHARGVIVEAELGRILGRGVDGDFGEGPDFLVDPQECVEFVKRTGVDSLAVGIGSAHGFYKGKPELNFQRLKEVNDLIDIPLVLHGGTGIPEEDVRRAIAGGMRKVNVGTIINHTYMNAVRTELNNSAGNLYTVEGLKPVKEQIKAVVKEWIRVCGCSGKAHCG